MVVGHGIRDDRSEMGVEEANSAIAAGEAEGALQLFEAELARGNASGAVHEGIGRARYLMTDYRGAVAAHEQGYTAYRTAGDLLGAARAARMLAWMHGNMFGDWAVRSGWLGRARTLLEAAGEESAEYGWVLMLEAENEADPARKEHLFEEAGALARRHGDHDLEFEALGWLGLQRAITGRVEEGMALLDEALAAVVAGEVQDLWVVEGTFCGLFWACERFHDVARAEQWVRVATDALERRKLVAVGAYCRAHYGGILTAAGRWREAEVELSEAVGLFDRGYSALKDVAVIRLADLRVRQGRFEEAGRLLDGLDQHPDAVGPLSALHLAEGRPAVARDLLERRLADAAIEADVAAPLLALLVEVQLAQDDVDAAGATAERLTELAEKRPDAHFLRASAALARGQVCMAGGDQDAAACLREALAAFTKAQMPVELARARLELARAIATDKPDVAVAEATAALEACQRLEAARHVDAAASLLRHLGVAAKPGTRTESTLTKREAEILALLGEGLSNAEIGDRLYLSRKTVEHHVGRVLSKLGVRSRAGAAAYAIRQRSGSD